MMDLAAQPCPPPQQKSIMLVDDEILIINLLRDWLEGEGYAVIGVTDANAAKTAARESKPDLVITDVVMPDMNGFSMAEELFKAPESRKIPVIFISAYAIENICPKSFKNPFPFAQLKKPFDMLDLSQLIRDLLTSPTV